MGDITEEEILDRYHGGESFSFGGKHLVRDKINISERQLDDILAQSNVYTEFKQFKKPKLTPPVRTYGKNYLWEADLMFFTHPTFSKNNDGCLYILAIIDTFTKIAMLNILKTKNTTEVTKHVNDLFQSEKPKFLRVDAGGEFLSKAFTQMCKMNDVNIYVAMEPIKCAFIERFNRTFKRILVQIMEFHNSLRWKDFVPQVLEIYHNRYHRGIKMSPNEAEMAVNHDKILKINLKRYAKFDQLRHKKNKKPSKFKKGDLVKLFAKKGIFTKGYAQSATKEYFEIYHVDRRLSKDRYYLKDLKGEKVIGSFYDEYLVPFSANGEGEFWLDPNFPIKKKRVRGVPYVWVKWLGWPEKFNQWVKESYVRRLIPDVEI